MCIYSEAGFLQNNFDWFVGGGVVAGVFVPFVQRSRRNEVLFGFTFAWQLRKVWTLKKIYTYGKLWNYLVQFCPVVSQCSACKFKWLDWEIMVQRKQRNLREIFETLWNRKENEILGMVLCNRTISRSE